MNRKMPWGKLDKSSVLLQTSICFWRRSCCVRYDWEVVKNYEFFPQTGRWIQKSYFSQLNRFKAAIDEKNPELANQKTSCLYANSTDIVTVWMGCSPTHAVLLRLCTFGLLLNSIPKNSLENQFVIEKDPKF